MAQQSQKSPKERTYRKHPAPRPDISVSTEIIAKSKRKHSANCMIATAIRDQVPEASSISVDLQTIRFSDKKKGLRYIYLTPRIAQDALVRFDRGILPPAFSFRLRGAHVTAMKLNTRGQRKLAHKLGRRKLSATTAETQSGVVPEIVGGKAPGGHPASKRREFGLRNYTLDDVVPEKAIQSHE